MKPLLDLSVIIPAYNEADNFHRGTLNTVVDFLSTLSLSWELLLVNDGSTDDTSKLLHHFSQGRPNVKVLDNRHRGKAATIISGALAGKGKYIIFSDMDQATPITEVSKLLEKLSKGYDVAIGSRSNRKGAPVFRQILAYGMIILRTLILRLPYRDTQCGFKGFTHPAAHRLFEIVKSVHPPENIVGAAVNPGFDVELLYLARKLGLKVAEVPIVWHHQETRRVSFVKDAIAGVRELFLVRWRAINNIYNL